MGEAGLLERDAEDDHTRDQHQNVGPEAMIGLVGGDHAQHDQQHGAGKGAGRDRREVHRCRRHYRDEYSAGDQRFFAIEGPRLGKGADVAELGAGEARLADRPRQGRIRLAGIRRRQ